MNLNWHKQEELIFQLAHEIAHIKNHDNCNFIMRHMLQKSGSKRKQI